MCPLLQLLGAELAVKQLVWAGRVSAVHKLVLHVLVDRISELGDGILGGIVSRLPLKQAVATCVLSKRWRYVWSHTRTLNFHDDYRFPEEPLEPEKRKENYVKFVDDVLKHHTGEHLDYFLALFDVEKDKSTNTTVSKWLEFAEKAKAQTVTLLECDGLGL
ncbi:PREDICTED: F-box/LRR-repeat [Prunus dulcis]|uniref:PREDICTED: F-box/LRR-repeat n=1 Tax=Prunus dulcis TaxID=3755 RepID=A0A5E4E8X0_PRUDU|nr:hypothetical protein L3X38_007044 [Prunus dulcis]VVA11726.1 PREDICTED: F-box/LRR-repeat [Prunus dulcis]